MAEEQLARAIPTVPTIPEYITVHLGRPDSAAPNVTVSFPDYIKNVASSEIYPTWPEAALRANIYAQTGFALNRVFTEWYRSRGYDFDITNSTAFDQSFVPGRDIFEPISRIVDEQFNSYVRRRGRIEPLFTAYCDGREVRCSGLEQLATVPLARKGMSALEILRYFYGNDIELVTNAPVQNLGPSYPGTALRRGDASQGVQLIQNRLNRIARNYPGIPKIFPANSLFGQSTEDAVRAFQRIFGLVQDGVVGPATWNRIAYIFASVKRLAELDSEGLTVADLPDDYPGALREGARGMTVRQVQYFLAVIGAFIDAVRPITVTGVYDRETVAAVRDFQAYAGLAQDGIVGFRTWRAIYAVYRSILASGVRLETGLPPYPGEVIASGASGANVRQLQTWLAAIARVIPSVPSLTVDGRFGPRTESSVKSVQRLYGLPADGRVGPLTWDAISSLYYDLTGGGRS